jgi:hypothetical protein
MNARAWLQHLGVTVATCRKLQVATSGRVLVRYTGLNKRLTVSLIAVLLAFLSIVRDLIQPWSVMCLILNS